MTLPPCTDAFTNTAVKLRNDGLSWVQIAREMDRRGIPCPNRNSWNADGVQRLVEGHRNNLQSESCGNPKPPFVLPWECDRLEVIKLRESGLSIPKIASTMNDAGRKAPRGGPWTNSAVQRALEYVPVVYRGGL